MHNKLRSRHKSLGDLFAVVIFLKNFKGRVVVGKAQGHGVEIRGSKLLPV